MTSAYWIMRVKTVGFLAAAVKSVEASVGLSVGDPLLLEVVGDPFSLVAWLLSVSEFFGKGAEVGEAGGVSLLENDVFWSVFEVDEEW